MSLQQLLLMASEDKVADGMVEKEDDNHGGNHVFYDAAEGDDDYNQKSDFDWPAMVKDVIQVGGYTR